MPEFKSYCQFVTTVEDDNIHRIYHDIQYGFPIHDDNELFGRLLLEINQAGLNWTTILNKQGNFRKAYLDFDIQQVAYFSKKDRERLLNNVGIIRNKLKVNAAIHNAGEILKLQKEYGSFKNWLDKNHPFKLEEWVKLFKKTFKFTGGEITNEFLLSSSYLQGAHEMGCPIYNEILLQKPMWDK
jgi:DNA-3-methyladenine glycosylase I